MIDGEPHLTRIFKTTATALITAVAISGAAFAQDNPTETMFSVDELTCWDVMSLPAEEATFVVGMLLGFTRGTSKKAETSGAEIVQMIEAFDTICGKNPDMNAMEALQ